jgi:GTPase SAR1 family protein
MNFLETSAKNQKNVQEAFIAITRLIFEKITDPETEDFASGHEIRGTISLNKI